MMNSLYSSPKLPVTSLIIGLLACTPTAHGFQTSQTLPMRMDPVPRDEIAQRLGLKQIDPANAAELSIGCGPGMKYNLMNEHEVVCPVSGSHQGVLCTALLSSSQSIDCEDAESIANNHELVSQAILSGSLAASICNRCPGVNSMYYLPVVVTLVESLMTDEMESLDLTKLDLGKLVFNSGGLETNEILMDMGGFEDDGVDLAVEEENMQSIILYSCNTHIDQTSTTSDVYVLPTDKNGKIWRFCAEYKVTTINLQQIASFGDRDSTTPLRPEVWLKDDSY